MTGVILSGGKNTRMGQNKAFLKMGEERLIDRTVRLFHDIFRKVIIVTTRPLDYIDQDATIVTDILPEKGALGGLYTGLFYSTDEHAFIAACDMPFLNTAFIEYMVLQADKGYDIIVPAPPDGLQPLHAIYARRCLPDIRSRLDRNRLQIKGFYPGRRILEISPETLHTFDPEERMFLNVNTPEDLQKLSSVRGTDEKGGSHALRV